MVTTMHNVISFWIVGLFVFLTLVALAVVAAAVSVEAQDVDLVDAEVQMLSERLASGEIDEDEFWTRLRSLGLT
jgi:uncharacterized membrane protein